MERTREEHEWIRDLNAQIERVSCQYNDFIHWLKPNEKKGSKTSSDQISVDRLSNGLKAIFMRLRNGFHNIIQHLLEMKETDPLALDTTVLQHIQEMITIATLIGAQQPVIIGHVANGECIQDALGLSDEAIDALYMAGKYFYDNQLYEEASHAFTLLSLINPLYSIFWGSLGNCEYFLGKYKQALMAYALASQAEPEEPSYHIFSAHCHKALGNKGAALSSLNLAEIAPNDDEVRKRVKYDLERLRREIEAL